MSEELINQVKKLIIDSLRIEGMSPEEIDSDAPLFGEGLGLDSIDALQLVVAMERDFGVVVPDAATGTKVFQVGAEHGGVYRGKPEMKLLLVSPGWPRGRLWGELGFKFPSLSLAAIAAVTPPHWEVALCDENLQGLDFSAEADLVAITAMTPQAPRAYEIAALFKARGTTGGHGRVPCQQPPR